MQTVSAVPEPFPPSPYWPDENDPASSLERPLAVTAARDSDVDVPVALGSPRPVRGASARLVLAAVLIAVGAAAVWLPTARERYVLEQVSARVTPLVWEVSCTTVSEQSRGTGFVFEGSAGPFLLTNLHVVRGCVSPADGSAAGVIEVGRPGAPRVRADVVEFFSRVDAAVLSSSGLPQGLPVGPPPGLGDFVAVVGHPGNQRDVFVSGRVLEREGPSFVVAVRVDGGSSGSPALSQDGEAVGLVSAKLVGGVRDAAQVFTLTSVCELAESC